MMAILWGGGTAIRPGPIPFLSGPLPLVVGLVLAIAYIVVVVSQFRTRPRIQTAQSAFVAVLLVVAAGVVMFFANMVRPLAAAALAASGPSRSSVLRSQAEDARLPASAFLETGVESGSLLGTDWSNPAGGQVAVAVSWVRNAAGVLVTTSPKGAVPRLQDGTPQRQLFLGADVLAFPLDHFMVETGHRDFTGFDDWLSMFNRVIDRSAPPIIGFAKGNDSRLPSVEQADAILANVNGRFGFYIRRGGRVEFVIESHAYEKKRDGIFEIRCAWSCEYRDPGVPSSNGDGPVTGVVSIDFTASGLMLLGRKNGKTQHPFAEVIDACAAKGLPAAGDD